MKQVKILKDDGEIPEKQQQQQQSMSTTSQKWFEEQKLISAENSKDDIIEKTLFHEHLEEQETVDAIVTAEPDDTTVG